MNDELWLGSDPDLDEFAPGDNWVMMSASLAVAGKDGEAADAFWTGERWGRLRDAKTFPEIERVVPGAALEPALQGQLGIQWVSEATYLSLLLYRIKVTFPSGEREALLIWAKSTQEATRAVFARFPDAMPYATTILS